MWTFNVLNHVWEAWFLIWEARNAKVHGVDAASRAAAARGKIERRVRALYARKLELMPRDRDLLYDTVDEHLERSTTTQLTNWYNTYSPVFVASFRESASRAVRGVRSIATYFTRG